MKTPGLFLIMILSLLHTTAQEKKIYESDVLKGATTPKLAAPAEKVCFDKQFSFVYKSGARSHEGCFHVNTKLGITAASSFHTSGAADCSFDIDEKKFYLLLFGMKGNEYIYMNKLEKRKQDEEGELKHYVITGNTHKNPMQQVLDAKVLFNKQRSLEFCDGKYKAWEYRSADEKDILYLFGKEYPPDMVAQAYLGAYGLGYLKTNKGNYFIMKQTHGQTSFTVTAIEDLETAMACFDPSQFQVYEETKVVKELEDFEKRGQEIDRELAKQEDRMMHRNTPCSIKKYAILQYKKEQNDKQKQLMEKMKDQHIQRSNPETIRSLAKEYDFIEGIKMERLQVEYDLCILKGDVENGRFKPGSESHSKAMQKISCWEARVNEYKKFEEDIKSINNRNRNDIDKAIREKGEYFKDNIAPRMGQLRCR
jgi:hypothetical protein